MFITNSLHNRKFLHWDQEGGVFLTSCRENIYLFFFFFILSAPQIVRRETLVLLYRFWHGYKRNHKCYSLTFPGYQQILGFSFVCCTYMQFWEQESVAFFVGQKEGLTRKKKGKKTCFELVVQSLKPAVTSSVQTHPCVVQPGALKAWAGGKEQVWIEEGRVGVEMRGKQGLIGKWCREI